MLKMFSNCSVVLENLEVTYTQKHHSLEFLQVCILTQQLRISACPQCDKSSLGLVLWKIKGQPDRHQHFPEFSFKSDCYFSSYFPDRQTSALTSLPLLVEVINQPNLPSFLSVNRRSGWICSDRHERCRHRAAEQPEADPRTEFVRWRVRSAGDVKLQTQPHNTSKQRTHTTTAEQPEW